MHLGKQKILVTGGAGFIGSNFIRYALAKNANIEIICVDKLTYAGNQKNLSGLIGPRCQFIVGDICDQGLMKKLAVKCDIIINFAAESHNDNSLIDTQPFMNTNIMGTYTLLEIVRKYNIRYHHISTDEVYGDLPLTSNAKFDETSPYRPSSPYSASKASADLLVRAWIRSFGIKATISNSTNNYGCYQHTEKFIPQQIKRLKSHQPAYLYGTGENIRDWLHVTDHVRALYAILAAGEIGETYLISSDCLLSNQQIVAALLEIMHLPADFYEYGPDRPGHDLKYALDNTKVKTALNWLPLKTDIMANLQELVAFYR